MPIDFIFSLPSIIPLEEPLIEACGAHSSPSKSPVVFVNKLISLIKTYESNPEIKKSTLKLAKNLLENLRDAKRPMLVEPAIANTKQTLADFKAKNKKALNDPLVLKLLITMMFEARNHQINAAKKLKTETHESKQIDFLLDMQDQLAVMLFFTCSTQLYSESIQKERIQFINMVFYDIDYHLKTISTGLYHRYFTDQYDNLFTSFSQVSSFSESFFAHIQENVKLLHCENELEAYDRRAVLALYWGLYSAKYYFAFGEIQKGFDVLDTLPTLIKPIQDRDTKQQYTRELSDISLQLKTLIEEVEKDTKLSAYANLIQYTQSDISLKNPFETDSSDFFKSVLEQTLSSIKTVKVIDKLYIETLEKALSLLLLAQTMSYFQDKMMISTCENIAIHIQKLTEQDKGLPAAKGLNNFLKNYQANLIIFKFNQSYSIKTQRMTTAPETQKTLNTDETKKISPSTTSLKPEKMPNIVSRSSAQTLQLKTIKELEAALNGLKNQNSTLTTQLEQRQTKIKAAQDKRKKTIALLQLQQSTLEAELSELQNKIDKLQEKRTEEDSLRFYEMQEMEKNIASLEQNNTHLKSLSEETEQAKILQTTENINSQTQIAERSKQKEASIKSQKELEQRLKKISEEFDQLCVLENQQKTKLEELNAHTEQDKMAIKEDFSKSQKNYRQLKETQKSLKKHLDDLKTFKQARTSVLALQAADWQRDLEGFERISSAITYQLSSQLAPSPYISSLGSYLPYADSPFVEATMESTNTENSTDSLAAHRRTTR